MADLFDSLGSLFGGILGSTNNPYKDAMKQFQKYANQSAGYQNPFFNLGKDSIGPYQDWLSGMKDPSEFLNNLMGNYKESEGSKYLQDQAMKAATNAASASGLTGSTPFQLQAQQNASGIAAEDMNSWLQNALGINSQYGQGLQGNINFGQNAANNLSNIFGNLGQNMGQGKFGQNQMNNNNLSDIFSGLLGLFQNFR